MPCYLTYIYFRREPFTIQTSSQLDSWQGHITHVFTEEQFSDNQYEDEDDWSIITDVQLMDSAVSQSMSSQYAATAESLVASAANVVSSLWPFK